MATKELKMELNFEKLDLKTLIENLTLHAVIGFNTITILTVIAFS